MEKTRPASPFRGWRARYHALLVSDRTLLLGTHVGVFASTDGGRSWRSAGLRGLDAMNLARGPGKVVWAAGHEMFGRTDDGGRSWRSVRPRGLPSLDVHGLAADPRGPSTLYAAVNGRGLYRSTDGARTFRKVATAVGGDVMALEATRDGRLFAGDMQKGVLVSRDGGRTWRKLLSVPVMSIAVSGRDGSRVLLGSAPAVVISRNGGAKWTLAFRLRQGVGPVAWLPGSAKVAYAVGLDRTLYRTGDGASTWRAVR